MITKEEISLFNYFNKMVFSPGCKQKPHNNRFMEAPTRVKKNRRKEKKQKIEISLWINGYRYEFGIMCTFCTKIIAVCHCPECPDFYCTNCDTTAHATKKRKDHKRSTLSKLNLDAAAGLITRAIRRSGHIRMLQARCLKTIKRFFDKKTLNYYYYNPVYDTVSWRKPYCLGKLEFTASMESNYAATKCQNLYYIWKAREKVRNEILKQYSKIFDRRNGAFYYAFNGPSNLLPRASWRKPRFLGKRSYPRDIQPIYTRDVACITIQRKWRAILVRQFLRALVRSSHDEVWDPVKGQFNYYNRDSQILYLEKPKLLRKEAWDPNRVPDWDIDRVVLFLRRIGLKCYIDTFRSYNVDGRALALLDDEDFNNLNITNRVHIKKILVEVRRIYLDHGNGNGGGGGMVRMSDEHAARRELIRRQKKYHAAATMIQRNFRAFAARRFVTIMHEVMRIHHAEAAMHQQMNQTNIWYTGHASLPSKDPYIAAGWIEVRREGGELLLANTTTRNSSSSDNVMRLPPLKSFGRNRDYLSYRGWGRRGGGGGGSSNSGCAVRSTSTTIYDSISANEDRLEGTTATTSSSSNSNVSCVISNSDLWTPSLAAVSLAKGEFLGDAHASRICTDKLQLNGYNDKRMRLFKETAKRLIV